MVHILPGGRSSGSGRYFPFPVPESRPIEPVGSVDRKRAIIGHGLSDSKIDHLILESVRLRGLLYNVWKKNGWQFCHKSYERACLRGPEHYLLLQLAP